MLKSAQINNTSKFRQKSFIYSYLLMWVTMCCTFQVPRVGLQTTNRYLGSQSIGWSRHNAPGQYPAFNKITPERRLFIQHPVSTTHWSRLDVYGNLKLQLPWLNNVLQSNGTLSIVSGNYKLAVNEEIEENLDCPKTPINGTAGVCKQLTSCSQVFPLLTSEIVFKEYLCLSDRLVGICCPTS